jgi:hypothetical protein
MAQKAVRGSQRSIGSIVEFDEAGFKEPFRGATNGASESEARIKEPEIVTGIPTASPDDLIDGGISGDGFSGTRKRRGRPSGSRNAPKQASTQNIAEHLESLLLSVHLMGAAFFNTPELALDPEEALKLSNAIKDVAAYYPVVFDPKKIAIGNLGIVLLTIYGTRGVTIWRRMKSETALKPKQVPTQIRTESSKSPGNPGPSVLNVPSERASQAPNNVPVEFRAHTTVGVNDEHIMDV